MSEDDGCRAEVKRDAVTIATRRKVVRSVAAGFSASSFLVNKLSY